MVELENEPSPEPWDNLSDILNVDNEGATDADEPVGRERRLQFVELLLDAVLALRRHANRVIPASLKETNPLKRQNLEGVVLCPADDRARAGLYCRNRLAVKQQLEKPLNTTPLEYDANLLLRKRQPALDDGDRRQRVDRDPSCGKKFDDNLADLVSDDQVDSFADIHHRITGPYSGHPSIE